MKKNLLNIGKKRFCQLCGIGKKSLHNYFSENFTEFKIIIDPMVKGNRISKKLLNIAEIKNLHTEINDFLTSVIWFIYKLGEAFKLTKRPFIS